MLLPLSHPVVRITLTKQAKGDQLSTLLRVVSTIQSIQVTLEFGGPATAIISCGSPGTIPMRSTYCYLTRRRGNYKMTSTRNSRPKWPRLMRIMRNPGVNWNRRYRFATRPMPTKRKRLPPLKNRPKSFCERPAMPPKCSALA